jgi:hypothetical protein
VVDNLSYYDHMYHLVWPSLALIRVVWTYPREGERMGWARGPMMLFPICGKVSLFIAEEWEGLHQRIGS